MLSLFDMTGHFKRNRLVPVISVISSQYRRVMMKRHSSLVAERTNHSSRATILTC